MVSSRKKPILVKTLGYSWDPVIVYVGVDPGLLSGIMRLTVFQDGSVGKSWTEVRAQDFRPSFLHELGKSQKHLTHVGLEHYVMRPGSMKKSRQPEALEISGIVKDVCNARREDLTIDLFQPGESKRLVPARKLRRAEMYSTKMPHANDAARIVLATVAVYDPELFAQLTGVDD